MKRARDDIPSNCGRAWLQGMAVPLERTEGPATSSNIAVITWNHRAYAMT